ncbi:MAG: PaaI family thioesterase [Proteobacteria bacterium]|nr:PaaI family thioesterase [Pseudomonadota bacterium]
MVHPSIQSSNNATGIDIYIPFAEYLGVRAHRQENGEVEIALALRKEHHNSWGVAHGGVILSVLDMVMGLSAKSIDELALGAITIEIKTNFLQTVTKNLRAKAKATRMGRKLIFVEGELFNENGELAAKASGTFKLKYPKEKII